MNRRRTLAGFAAGTAAGMMAPIVAKAGNPDAELIDLCARFDANERAYRAHYETDIPIEGEAAREAVTDAIHDEQAALVDRMIGYRVTSLAGLQAVARSLALWDPRLLDPDGGEYLGDKLTAMLVRDARRVS
jgi:hypothetical protein